MTIDAGSRTEQFLSESASAAEGDASALTRGVPATGRFNGVLFAQRPESSRAPTQPDCFSDLHLDQIVAAVTEGRDEYELVEFFYRPLHTVAEVEYRHAVLRDLASQDVLAVVRSFAEEMDELRKQLALAHKLHHHLQKERWFLSAATVYRDAVRRLASDLAEASLDSGALIGLRDHVRLYVDSSAFEQLSADSDELAEELGRIRYVVQTKGARVRVAPYEDATDLPAEVEHIFARFQQGAVKNYRVNFRQYAELNHIETQILELVARLYAETFSRLEQYCRRYASTFEQTIMRFDREIQFYLAYLEHIETFKAAGLSFCLPEVAPGVKDSHAHDGFDLSLAAKLADQASTVVTNDFALDGPERILVVTGPNQGGKTTFARMFGQLHYLASLGLPVAASHARLTLADELFTHFEREENLETLRGKFEDELVRIHQILQRASGESVLVMNESFGSTTLQDARRVGTAIMGQIIDLDALCLFVTFIDELASLDDATVSMMSTVDPEEPARRTFTIARKRADGLAYAAALAEKYGLTYALLRRRIDR